MECGNAGPQGEHPRKRSRNDRDSVLTRRVETVRYCRIERSWRHRHPGRSPSCCGRGATATMARSSG